MNSRIDNSLVWSVTAAKLKNLLQHSRDQGDEWESSVGGSEIRSHVVDHRA